MGLEILGADEVAARLKELVEVTPDALEAAAKVGVEILAEEANQRAPGPNIVTKRAQHGKRRVSYDFGPDKKHYYYQFAETGTQPHQVKGRPRLAFIGDEGWVLFPEMMHPGTPARPFMRPAMDAKGGEAMLAMGQAFWETMLEAVE